MQSKVLRPASISSVIFLLGKIRLALRAVEPERGVGVAEALFRGRVPADGLAQPVAGVGEVAAGDGAAAELDIAGPSPSALANCTALSPRRNTSPPLFVGGAFLPRETNPSKFSPSTQFPHAQRRSPLPQHKP